MQLVEHTRRNIFESSTISMGKTKVWYAQTKLQYKCLMSSPLSRRLKYFAKYLNKNSSCWDKIIVKEKERNLNILCQISWALFCTHIVLIFKIFLNPLKLELKAQKKTSRAIFSRSLFGIVKFYPKSLLKIIFFPTVYKSVNQPYFIENSKMKRSIKFSFQADFWLTRNDFLKYSIFRLRRPFFMQKKLSKKILNTIIMFER